MQLHARGRTHLGHLVHPKATDLQMEYSDIPSANPSLYDPYKKKSPSGSEDPRMEPAEAAAEAKEQRDKGWNAERQDGPMPSSAQVGPGVDGPSDVTGSTKPVEGWPLPASALGTSSPCLPWAGEIWSRSEAAQTCAQKPATLEPCTACFSQAAPRSSCTWRPQCQ